VARHRARAAGPRHARALSRESNAARRGRLRLPTEALPGASGAGPGTPPLGASRNGCTQISRLAPFLSFDPVPLRTLSPRARASIQAITSSYT
jgi:hypothetical protein